MIAQPLAGTRSECRRRIGIDFDNTIIGYDRVFLASAIAAGLLDEGFSGSKQAIRDAIRTLPDGEITWQKLQGSVYGKGIGGAEMFAGLDRFLRRCRANGDAIFIVSHKTEYGHFDPDRVNLRHAAADWMRRQRFFETSGYGIPVENVFFESTRAAKLKRIASLGISHFVDDLEEVLGDPDFPAGVERLLFSGQPSAPLPYAHYPTWAAIERAFFDERA